MKMLNFYKVYDWMISEFGFSLELGAYCLIYSFRENGMPCTLSKQQFAEYMGCAKCSAIRTLQALIEHGYISETPRPAPQSTVYQIIESKAQELQDDSIKMRQSQNETVSKCDSQQYQNATVNSIKMRQSIVSKCDTNREIIENEIESEKESVCAPAEPAAPPAQSDADSFILLGTAKNVKLSQKQYDHLKHGTKCAKGKSLESYIQIASSNISNGKKYKDVYGLLLKWILQDGGCELGEREERQNRLSAEQQEEFFVSFGF